MTASSKTPLLDKTNLPKGIRSFSITQLNQLAKECRHELISVVSTIGGHFASSLGATEITVAIHHCFDTPNDQLIWDVGHQGYIHKMLTGRRHLLKTIRKKDGISGFLKRDESPYDNFGAGHAGTSISAAVGIATALAKTHPERKVVAVIGDGSMTAGMAFEALNHAGSLRLPNLIVVLNDNEISISPNVGALSWMFSRAVTSRVSSFARSGFKQLYRSGYVPEIIYKTLDRAEEAAQGMICQPAMLFEGFGFRYIGPVDGHNISDLITAIEHAKNQDCPVLIHAYTNKGKGYDAAEDDPIKWHAVSPFNPDDATFNPVNTASLPPTYTSVFANTLIEIAKNNPTVVAITAAMAGGTGLDKFQVAFPDRFFDVGIAEQHAVTFAAGLATQGFTPFCTIYSTFLQRAYDQVLHDVCIQKLPVVFPMDRAGVVGNDGETHQGVFDISFLRTIPNIVLMAPKDENELRHMLYTASKYKDGATGIRFPRGHGLGVSTSEQLKLLPIGKGEVMQEGSKILLIAAGTVTQNAVTAAEKIKEQTGLTPTIINARFIKPLDEELIIQYAKTHDLICTVEDHALMGGFGSAVLECLADNNITHNKILRFGVRDEFIPHAGQSEQQLMYGYDSDSIAVAVILNLSKKVHSL